MQHVKLLSGVCCQKGESRRIRIQEKGVPPAGLAPKVNGLEVDLESVAAEVEMAAVEGRQDSRMD